MSYVEDLLLVFQIGKSKSLAASAAELRDLDGRIITSAVNVMTPEGRKEGRARFQSQSMTATGGASILIMFTIASTTDLN